MFKWFFRLAAAKNFYPFAGKLLPWLTGLCIISLVYGLYLGLFNSPPDYQQGETVRIMYVHVPAAWMSMFVYAMMAGAAIVGLVWKIKLADTFVTCSAPIGASFTVIALITGSLWGKPMWGAWWVWDARLTSELILLFLYVGFMALQSAIDDPRRAARAGGVLIIVGVVNLPVIHYSVEWWNTLHQPASVARADGPSIDGSILAPLLIMAVAFKFYFFSVVLVRMRGSILEIEEDSSWIKEARI